MSDEVRPRWRAGTKLGRTLYRNNHCVGMVDTPELAAEIVAALNGVAVNDRAWIAAALGREANRVYHGGKMDYPSNVLDAVSFNIQMGATDFLSERKHPNGMGLERPDAPVHPERKEGSE